MTIGSATNHHDCGLTLIGLSFAGFELAMQSACVIVLGAAVSILPSSRSHDRSAAFVDGGRETPNPARRDKAPFPDLLDAGR